MRDTGQGGHPERLSGAIERITFHNEQTGFCVLKVQVDGRREPVSVVGVLPEVRAGEWLQAEGAWRVDPDHGPQFRAERLSTAAPTSLEGIERYLSSGLVRGIGPKLAGRLVRRFGTDVLNVIESAPRKLLQVRGIGRERVEGIRQAWQEQKATRQIMLFLHGHGVSTGRAFRIYKTYGPSAIERIRQDPYCLSRDVWGIGFKTADQIAANMGVDRLSPLRARAGVEHVLQEITTDGHCACPRETLLRQCEQILEIPAELAESAVEQAVADGRLIPDRDARGQELIYLAALHRAESELARDLVDLSRGPHPCPPIDLGKALEWVQRKIGLTLADEQRRAVEQATKAKVLVLTGGPGVGKTTIVNAILKILAAKKLKVVLCAPTGRAAKRLSETTGAEARTIHRLLAYDPASGRFRHGRDNPIEGDVVIIDETSMVDLALAHHVVRAVPPQAALLLVGDVDQLPSVGPGCVLRDVIDSRAVPVCRLTEVFRQAAQSAIVTNAHRVNQGRMPVFPEPAGASGQTPPGDCFLCKAEDPDKALQIILQLIRQRIPRRFGLDPIDDIQVITPMHRGTLGGRNLNLVLQRELNPGGPAVERFGWAFRAGDKVLQTVNNYDKDVFNGDIGRIAEIDPDQGGLVVRFEDRLIPYALGELDELTLSYAITVHKSQGSEYPAVIVPVHTQHYVMLQRNLLYTAITRSRRLLVLVGTERAIALAVQRAASRRRITMLGHRLARAAGIRQG